MKQLTGKIMEEKLKIGWTTTDFAQFFDVTEEEFLNRLNKAFTEKACADTGLLQLPGADGRVLPGRGKDA